MRGMREETLEVRGTDLDEPGAGRHPVGQQQAANYWLKAVINPQLVAYHLK